MARATSTGTCRLCDGTFSRAGMGRHIGACRKRAGLQGLALVGSPLVPDRGRPGTRSFHISVKDRYDPRYWLHLEMADNLPLEDLDTFLRGLWLECCGHLSAFYISGVTYQSGGLEWLGSFGGPKPKSLRVPAHRALEPGQSFTYKYDFGTTTELALRVLPRQRPGLGKQIRLLAINDPPSFACNACGTAPADVQCTECNIEMFSVEDHGYLCNSCRAGHDCDDWAYAPVVNSPRSGMCGYVG